MCARIVLHADDFGFNEAVSQGILRGFSHGLLTSTALLANAPGASDAIAGWKTLLRAQATGAPLCPQRAGLEDARRPFDLGVHLNLTQGRPLSGARYPAALVDREGRFPGVFRLFARLQAQARQFRDALRAELTAQIAFLADHGLRPTHLNGHQYIEIIPAVRALLPELLAKFAIPVVRVAVEPALARTTLVHQFRGRAWLLALCKRHFARRLRASAVASVAASTDDYFGTAHAGLIDAQVMDLYLANIGGHGTVEIGMHPGYQDHGEGSHGVDDGWSDPLSSLRPQELALLESPAFAQRLRGRGVRLGRLSQLGEAAERRAA